MTIKRMDNGGIVVEDIDAAIEFFTELGLELGQTARHPTHFSLRATYPPRVDAGVCLDARSLAGAGRR